MNQTDIRSAAAQAAQTSKSLLVRQVDKQAVALGSTLSQTARDLEKVGSSLGESGTIGSAAQLAQWAANYVDQAGTYLQGGDSERFVADLETFARQRPWVVAASAAALGFISARIVKSSSARRYAASSYADAYDENYAYRSNVPSASVSAPPAYGSGSV